MMIKKITHWSQYWAFGSLTSLPQDFKVNYDGELSKFWSQILIQEPTETTIVDVCTGNLALPLLFSQLNEIAKKNMTLLAVDLAKIDKTLIAEKHKSMSNWLKEIQVIDETAIEDIANKISHPVNLITSQYGLEYCETESIAPQLAALLKPGGRLVFMSHASDTAILVAMKAEKEAFDVLHNLKVFDTMKGYGDGSYKAVYFQKQIQKQIKALHEKLIERPVQLLQIFHQALSGLSQLTLQQLMTQKDAVFKFYSEQWMAQMRAADLLYVSEKIANNPNWYQPFEDAGLILESKETIWFQGKHNAGTAFQFIKPTI